MVWRLKIWTPTFYMEYQNVACYTYQQSVMMLVFWAVTPCGLTGRYQHCGEAYYLHLQPWRQFVCAYKSTLCHNPEDQHQNLHFFENLLSHNWTWFNKLFIFSLWCEGHQCNKHSILNCQLLSGVCYYFVSNSCFLFFFFLFSWFLSWYVF